MYTEVNVVDVVLFIRSRANTVVTSRLEIPKTLFKKRTEQHFQDVAQKFTNDKNLDSFSAHFVKHFTQKPGPQQFCEIMSFDILSTVNPIGSMKTWGESSCTLCTKERIEIIDKSRRRYSRIINACSEEYGACRHIQIFHRFTQH